VRLEGGTVGPVDVEGPRECGSGVRVRPAAGAAFERGDRRGTQARTLGQLLLRQAGASAQVTQQDAEVDLLASLHTS
jgi:hypothetical protein